MTFYFDLIWTNLRDTKEQGNDPSRGDHPMLFSGGPHLVGQRVTYCLQD